MGFSSLSNWGTSDTKPECSRPPQEIRVFTSTHKAILYRTCSCTGASARILTYMSCMRSGFFSVAFCCLCLCRNLSMVWCGRDSDKWKWDLSMGSFSLCFRFPTRTLCVPLLKSQTEAHYSTTLGSRVLRTTSTGSTICTKTQTMIFTCVWLGRMNWKKCKQSSIRCKTKELRKFALPTILTLAINEKNKT